MRESGSKTVVIVIEILGKEKMAIGVIIVRLDGKLC